MKTCQDYYDQVGFDKPVAERGLPAHLFLSRDCCTSCHEDRDYGYPLMDIYEGDAPVAEVCCAVSRALKTEGSDSV